MTNRIAEILKNADIEYREHCSLAPFTSFKIGGECPLAVFPSSVREALTVLEALRELGAKYAIIGNGTNLLVPDEGFDGVAIILSGLRAVSIPDITDSDTEVSVTAEAGCPLTALALAVSKRSLSGLEFAYGIPGTLGGAVYMNAGAYGGEIADVTCSSEWYDMETGRRGSFTGVEQGFEYRKSAYSGSSKIILSATLRLKLAERSQIEEKMNDFMKRRRDKQPLELPSAGSVFKRGNGFITAQLIDEAGLKGRQIGGARVSDKHAGFIVNTGGATAADVLALVAEVERVVYERFGKTLEREIRLLGE